MNNRKLVEKWHAEIIHECEKRLDRKLTTREQHFIWSRGGFIALEMIEVTVKSMRGAQLEPYLN